MVYLVLGVALAGGVVLEVPIYRVTNRTFQRRGESLRGPVMLLGHAVLAVGIAGAVAGGIFLGQGNFYRAVVAGFVGVAFAALGNIVIQRERLRARRATSASA